jgi:two-component system, OmpR family, response regulator RegX3
MTELGWHSPATMATMRLLIVEDDLAIAEPLLAGLRHHGFDGTHVTHGAQAIASATDNNFDVVLLDLGLPDMDGLDVCREIRKHSSVPIIMVTARGEEIDRIVGLELGADDYVSKPYGIRELIARIRAVRRRFDSAAELASSPGSQQSEPLDQASGDANSALNPTSTIGVDRPPTNGSAPVRAPLAANENMSHTDDAGTSTDSERKLATTTMLNLGALVIDHRTHRVHLGGVELALTPKEFGLLVVLGADPGAAVPRMSIIEQVWDEHWYGPTKTLDVHIAQLRQKLGNPAWIETVRGVGYRLVDPAVSAEPGTN